MAHGRAAAVERGRLVLALVEPPTEEELAEAVSKGGGAGAAVKAEAEAAARP